MGQANFNMEDPALQEKIRRGPHEYIATAGKHGMYVPTDPRKNRPENVAPYKEYPKQMLSAERCPKPEFRQFKDVNGIEIPNDVALANFQAALVEWDRALEASVVHNKEQEREWLKANG